jgi:hypothetical protein
MDMKDALTSLRMEKRKVDKRVTKENKNQIINAINKNSSELGFGKLSKNASIAEVTRFKNQYVDRLTYDIVTVAINTGRDIVAEVEARELRKVDDIESQRIGKFAKELAKAKKESDKKLNKEEKKFIERGNVNIKGYATENLVDIVDNLKNDKQVQALINEVKTQDPKKIFYDKQTELFDTVFQKVGIYRENDLNKVKDKLNNMSMEDAVNHYNYLLESLQLYDSDQVQNVNETELKNARLDDIMIRMNLKKTGKHKVQKVLNKYK